MKRVIYSLFVFGIILVGLTGCDTKNDGIKFKNDYEKLNGVTNSSGNEHRTVSIEEDNSFVYSTTEEIIAKINNNDTFYVYFGSPYCPWCRSVIEKAISVANSKGIDKIYYIDIWDDNYTELLRDTYKINDENEAELVKEGSDDYKELLQLFDNVLSDYSLKDNEGNKVLVGEKRIYAPNFIYIENGKAVKLTTGISEMQNDSREKLTNEILEDEELQFLEFFTSESNICEKDSKC